MISKNKIKLIRSLDLKKNRRETGLFVAEGPKVVADLLPYFECTYVAATPAWIAANGTHLPADFDEVAQAELAKASFLKTPQEVLALFRQPAPVPDAAQHIANRLCLALDDVQDPGNLGTIVRLADWFGIEDIFCSPATADIFNPKTVQATMGGLARVRVHYFNLPEFIASLPAGTPIYGTFLDGENLYGKTLQPHGLLVMGNEGNGISPAIARLVTERLYIPSFPPARATGESLNVAIATAIICAEFRRR